MWEGTWKVGTTSVRWAPAGTLRQFQLRLKHTDGRIDGYLVVTTASNADLTISLTGTLEPDHKVPLEGSTSGGTDDPVGAFQLTVWFSAGVIQGTLDYDMRMRYGPPREASHGTLSTTTKRSSDPLNTFEGTWRGLFLVRTCELVEWDYCYGGYVGETREVELVISQSGDRVTGTFWPTYSDSPSSGYVYLIDVSGQVTGDTLQLTGVSPFYPNNQRTTRRLLMFSATRDAVGRLSGSLTWQEDWVGPVASGTPDYLHRKTLTGDLHSVVQIN